MASNFGFDATQVSVDPSAAPILEGVQKQALPVKMIGDIFSGINESISADKEKKAANTLAAFTQQQLNVADALDQGSPAVPNSAFARSLMRKNLIDAIDANPSLAADLIKAQSSIVDLAGGADIVKDGDEEEQLWRATKASLVSDGMILPDASDSEVRIAASRKQSLAALAEAHKTKMDALLMEEKTLSLEDSRRKEKRAVIEETAFNFVREIAPDELVRVRNELTKIVNGPGSGAEKQQAVEAFYTQFLSDATSVTMGLKADDTTVFLRPFEALRDDFLKRASGEYNDEEMKKSIERAVTQQTLLLMADPEVARTVAVSELIGDNSFLAVSTASGMNKAFVNFIANGSTTSDPEGYSQLPPYTVNNATKTGFKTYLKGITSSVNAEDVGVREEALDRIQRVLDSTETFSGLVDKNPASAIEMVNWLASPEFASVMAQNPSLAGGRDAAREALSRNYSKEVWNMIDSEFLKNKVFTIPPAVGAGTKGAGMNAQASVKVASATDLATATSDPTGVKFVPTDPQNKDSVAKAKELNKTLKPIINTQIRAMAHLEGRTDYGTYWEESSDTFLRKGEGADTGDNLVVEDFKKLASLTAEFAPLQSAVDKTEGGGDYDAILNFSHRSGGEFEGVKVSDMTLQEAIDFSSSGGDYAQYSKEKVGRMATPMGRYQIVGATLKQTMKEMGLPADTKFDQTTQDAMFAHLVQKAISGETSLKKKRLALREVWEGFKNVDDTELDAAIAYFEG